VGMFYGAKRIDLVKLMVKYGLTRSVSISFSFSILFYFFSGSLMPLFTNSDEISRLAVLYFKIMAFAYPFITIGMTSTRIMQGLGYAYPMFILTLFRVVIIAASLAWYFVMVLGKPVHYAFVGTLISCILTSFVSITWLRSIIRKSFQPVLETG
jgi:Na+-driven multidrug efflux pump